MDIYFVNTTILTKDLYLKALQAHYKTTRKKYRYSLFSLAIFSFVLLVVEIIMRFDTLSAYMLFFCPFCFLLYSKAYLIHSNKGYKTVRALNPSGGVTHTFYYDNFISVAPDTQRKTDYSIITKVVETNDIFLFLFVEAYMVIDKNGFQQGNSDAFKMFLNEKCNPEAVKKLKK